jgi:DNA-binding Lrp family transcriptional regulator
MDAFEMFNLVLDRHTSKILDLTSDRPFHAAELSEVVGIPLAACYRRIRMLKEAGLIKEETKVQSDGGKSVSAYRSTVQSAEVILMDGRLRIQMTVDGEDSEGEIDYSTEASMLWWQQSAKEDE